MNTPGFTAEASLYRSRNTYRGATVESSASLPADSIVLAQRDLNPANSGECVECNLRCFAAYVTCLSFSGGFGYLACYLTAFGCKAYCERVGGPCCPQDCGDYCCYRADHCSYDGCCPAESAVCGGRCCGPNSYCCGDDYSKCCYYDPPFPPPVPPPPQPPGCRPDQQWCGQHVFGVAACCPPGLECCSYAVPGRWHREPGDVAYTYTPGSPPDCRTTCIH